MSGLFGSRVLETALGLTCIYLLLATFCSSVNEWIAELLAARSVMLEKAIRRLLGQAADQFYSHPLIQSLIHDGDHPEYIASGTFAKTLMDLATPCKTGRIDFDDLQIGIVNDLPCGALRTVLQSTLQGVEKRTDAAQQAIEKWFDDAMESLSHRYRRRARLVTASIAVAITIAANADTIRLARATLAGQSAAEVLGWSAASADWNIGVAQWFARVVGWMLTAAAVSLGAPFWFDAARNLVAATRPREAGSKQST